MGNKRRIASKILPHIPDHNFWLEPFFGAGGLFFNKPRAQRNIVNDLDGEVYNLFCVILDRSAELEETWCSMPISEDLWKAWKKEVPTDPVWRAVRFLFYSNFGFLGKPQTLQYNKKNAKRLLQDRITTTRELLYDVEFMNCDFRQMLRRIPMSKGDRAGAFIYADPPYLGTGNNYGEASTWREQDTRELFAELVASGLRFGVSEFDNPVVLDLAKQHGLRVVLIGERHNLRNKRMEVLVTNTQ
jgi:DNA adenine methylase